MNTQGVPMLKSVEWQWDRKSCILWASATVSDGRSYAIGIPLAHVVRTFEVSAAEVGLCAPPFVGDVDSVEGFLSGIKKLAKSAGRTVTKAVKKTQKALAKGVAAAGKVVSSKYTRIGVGALAVAFPAVGAPALAALTAANSAYATYRKADSALQSAKVIGKATGQTARAISKGANVQRSVKLLAYRAQQDPNARMAIAALKSVKV